MSFFRRLPWAMIVTWGLFLGLVYTLRSLFPVFFITFVISYICRNFVKFTYSPFGDRPYIRKVIVIITFALLLFGFYIGGKFLVPNIYEQGSRVYSTVLDLKFHEDVDSALPNLYATLRFQWFYKSSDEYKKDYEDFKENKDTNELLFEQFVKDAERIRGEFETGMIESFGSSAYEESKDSPEYRKEFNEWLFEQIEMDEYEPDKQALEEEADQILKETRTFAQYKSLKDKHGKTPEEWSNYLKKDILRELYNGFDTQKKFEYEGRFRKSYFQEQGENRLAELKGTPEWEDLFKTHYEELTGEEKPHPYDMFIKLEKAKTPTAYLRNLGDEDPEDQLERTFKEKKMEAFAKTFQAYGFVEELSRRTKEGFIPDVIKWVANVVEYTFTLAFHLILSVFLSFFIVWDIPRLKAMIGRLGTSRVRKMYNDVYPGLVSFGWLMGRAFQAQAIIAAVNTALTLSALSLLDVPHRTFLCSIVFICSFIPVVGVIISSVPIVLVSLQLQGGMILALELAGCILIIHFIETTVLNPKIMGDMLKLHPLLVLVILLVGEHFFGVWGLLLGVPVAVYIFRFVILRDSETFLPEGVAGLMPSSEEVAEKADEPAGKS